MSFKPFKWIKKHPIEAAAIAALAATGAGAAGIGPMAGLFAGEAAAGAGAGAGAAGAAGAGGASLAGAGAVAGDAFLPGLLAGTEGLAGGTSALLGGGSFLSSFLPEAPSLAASAFGPDAGMGFASSLLSAPEATPFITAGVEPFAMGATTAQSGAAGMFGPQAAQVAQAGWKMSPKEAMMLSQMVGGGQQEQRPMGAPVDMGNPMQRQAMMTQEQITKKWLLENDPNTYARIYGSPQPMGA